MFSLLYLNHNGGEGPLGFVENYAVHLDKMWLVTCFKPFAEVRKCSFSFSFSFIRAEVGCQYFIYSIILYNFNIVLWQSFEPMLDVLLKVLFSNQWGSIIKYSFTFLEYNRINFICPRKEICLG